MSLKSVDTKKAPGAVGPYSQAIAFERFCFTSGQLPINPETGELISDDIEKATEQSIKNVEAILIEAGFTLEDVVKTTIFVKDMKDFSKVNGVYEKYFSSHKPARSCVEVSTLPKNGLIEIEAIAYK